MILGNLFKKSKKRGVIINFYDDIEWLKHFVKSFPDCTIIPYQEFDPKLVKIYDYIILSGGDISIHLDTDIVEIKKYLLKTKKPVLGVCLGFEILGILMGGDLVDNNVCRLNKCDTEIFGQIYNVDYHHQWFFKDLPKGEYSKNYVDKFKSDVVECLKYKNYFGVQCHPERSCDDGKKIIDKFFEEYKLR